MRIDIKEKITIIKHTNHKTRTRQTEVLQLVAQGLTNKEVAASLFVTERTVKYHMSEILQKLHLQNRGQVIAYAVRTGLVSDENSVSE